MKEIDINAPIIPYESIGGIKLKSHIRDLWDIIINSKNVKTEIYDFKLVYTIDDTITFVINIINGKIYAIDAEKNYKGKLFGHISIGMNMDEVLKIDNSFIYNDFEELYISNKGIVIETEVGTNNILSIEIKIKERELDSSIKGEFDKGNW